MFSRGGCEGWRVIFCDGVVNKEKSEAEPRRQCVPGRSPGTRVAGGVLAWVRTTLAGDSSKDNFGRGYGDD